MKKFSLVIIAVISLVFAHKATAQVQVGAGYNMENFVSSSSSSDKDSDKLNGFYLEAGYTLNLLEKNWGAIDIQPMLKWSFFGESEQEELAGIKVKSSFAENYLDIPVNVRYSYEISPEKFKVYAFAGPVFSFGITSVTKSSFEDAMVKYHNYSGKVVTKGVETSVSSGEGIKDYGLFDLKLGIGAGVTLSEKIDVKLGYNIGLLNRYTGEQISKEHEYRYHTDVFFVGVAYNF